MTDLKTRFGKKVRALRRQRDLTQLELAERADISVDFLSLIERGRNAPSFKNIERLAQALEVEVGELFNFANMRE